MKPPNSALNIAPSLALGISVIVPVWNGARFLGEALDSIIAQTYPPLEVLVCDDGSTDESLQIAGERAERFPFIRVVPGEHGGDAAARNRGLRAARGEVVAFLDADDAWSPDALESHLRYWAAYPGTEATMGRQFLYLEGSMERPNHIKSQLLEGDHPGSTLGNLVARRELFERVGNFDTSFKISSDTDWLTRAREAGIWPSPLEAITLLKRVHETNLSHDPPLVHREAGRILKASLDRRRARSSQTTESLALHSASDAEGAP